MRVFRDGDDRAGVIVSPKKVRFLVYGARCVFPAMHYFEAHPEHIGKEVQVEKVDKLPSASKGFEVFNPELITDNAGKTFAYQNYNFVILNNGLVHPMSEVVGNYAEFVAMLGDKRQRKVKIQARHERQFRMIEKIGSMKEDAVYRVAARNGHPASIYLSAGSTSGGMTRRISLGDAAKSNLEKMIELR
jgi:hypothetical protein